LHDDTMKRKIEKMKGNSMQGRCEKLWTSKFTLDSLWQCFATTCLRMNSYQKKNIKPIAIQCYCIFWNLWYYFIFPRYCCSWIPCVISNISCFKNVHIQFQHQHTFMVCPSSLLLVNHFQLPIGPLKVIASLSLPFMIKLITCNIK
jgi:hypothetical protein